MIFLWNYKENDFLYIISPNYLKTFILLGLIQDGHSILLGVSEFDNESTAKYTKSTNNVTDLCGDPPFFHNLKDDPGMNPWASIEKSLQDSNKESRQGLFGNNPVFQCRAYFEYRLAFFTIKKNTVSKAISPGDCFGCASQ